MEYKNYLNEIRKLSSLIYLKKKINYENLKYKIDDLILTKYDYIHKVSLDLFDDPNVHWWQFAWTLLIADDMGITCADADIIMRREKKKYGSFCKYCIS